MLIGLNAFTADLLGAQYDHVPTAIAVSAKYIAASDNDGIVRFIDRRNMREVNRASVSDSVFALQWIADGKKVIVVGQSVVRILTQSGSASGKEIHVDPMKGPASVASTPDGSTVIIGFNDGSIEMWDTRRNLVRSARFTKNKLLTANVSISPDGKTLTCSVHNRLFVAETAQLRLKRELAFSDYVDAMFLNNNQLLISVADGRIWSSAVGKLQSRKLLTQASPYIVSATLCANGDCVAVISEMLWRTLKGKNQLEFRYLNNKSEKRFELPGVPIAVASYVHDSKVYVLLADGRIMGFGL